MQPLGEEEEEEEEDEMQYIAEIAKEYLNRPSPDKTFGITEKKGLYYISNKQAIIFRNNIIIDDKKFEGTPGLWESITSKNPKEPIGKEDYNNYERLMLKTNALNRDNNPNNNYPKGSKGYKWRKILSYIWEKSKNVEGKELWLFRAILTRC